MSRLDYLSRLIQRTSRLMIGISGTDGKTTTTAMLARILIHEGKDPSVLLGGVHEDLPYGNYRKGNGPILMEVCESDGELVLIRPWIGAVTNIRMDHLEHYHQLFEEYHDAIVSFLSRAQHRVSSRGILKQIEPQSRNHPFDAGNPDIDLAIPGQYNLMNASCAMVCASLLDIPETRSRIHLHTFRNVDRRFSIRFESDSLSIVDDYAHTPDEIESVVEACRETYPTRLVILAFEPHRYSRLERDGGKFERMLENVPTEKNLLLPIYSAYEPRKPHLYEDFCKRVIQKNGRSQYCESATDLYNWLIAQDRSNPTVILFVGAGNSSRFAKEVAYQIQIRAAEEEKV